MATETVQIEAAESKTLKFLKQLMDKNPKQNYHGAAVIAMSSLDIDTEMRNPNSKIRKDFLAAIEIQDFIAFINNVLLPEMVRKDLEIREMLYNMDIYPKSDPGQPLAITDFAGIPLQDIKQIEPLRQLLDDVKKLENLTLKLQQFEVDWRLEKVNFVKEKLEGALKKVEEKISAMPDEAPEKQKLMSIAKELTKDIVDLDQLKNEFEAVKGTKGYHSFNQELLSKYDHSLSSISENISKSADPDIRSLGNTLKNGLEDIDLKRLSEYQSKLQEISTLESSITSSIEKFEGNFGKNLGLGEALNQYKSGQNHTLSQLKDTLILDIPDEKAHHLSHFKK